MPAFAACSPPGLTDAVGRHPHQRHRLLVIRLDAAAIFALVRLHKGHSTSATSVIGSKLPRHA